MEITGLVMAKIPIPQGNIKPPDKRDLDALNAAVTNEKNRMRRWLSTPLVLPPDRRYDIQFSPGGV